MPGSEKVLFEPGIRVRMLKKLIYPFILSSEWEPDGKIRALYRHKLRVARSISDLGDATERDDLCTGLDDLYSQYIALIGASPKDVENCERAVKEELKQLEEAPKAASGHKREAPEEVSASVKWLNARVGMLRAHMVKWTYLCQACSEVELLNFARELARLEAKLSDEPDTRVKRAICAEIEQLRARLLSLQ